jgi:hypothetical protein
MPPAGECQGVAYNPKMLDIADYGRLRKYWV